MVRKTNIRKRHEPRYARAPWMVEYRLPGNKRRARFFPTRRDAEGYRQQLYRDLNPLSTSASLRFSMMVKAFLQAKRDISTYTRNLYTATYKRFLEICGDPVCEDITPVHIDAFIEGRASGQDSKQWQNQRTPSNVTINKDLRHLTAVFRWGIRRGYLHLNPIDRVDKLKTVRRQPRSWTPEQFTSVLKHLPEPWVLLAMLSLSGVRKSLLVNLSRSQVNMPENLITIPSQKGQAPRCVPLHPLAARLLMNWLENLASQEQDVFRGYKFHNSTWLQACQRAAVPHLKFHDLRTCVSTWLKQQGVSSDAVSKLFGHSTPILTYQVYTDLDDLETRRRVVYALPLLDSAVPAAQPIEASLTSDT